jgi:hypothetical protein
LQNRGSEPIQQRVDVTRASLWRPINGAKRHSALHSDEPAFHEIFEMGEDGKGGCVGKRRVEALVDIGDDPWDCCASGIEAGEDRFFARGDAGSGRAQNFAAL